MKFNTGNKTASGVQPPRKRIIFDSDTDDDDLGSPHSNPVSDEEHEDPDGDDFLAGLEWLKKFNILRLDPGENRYASLY